MAGEITINMPQLGESVTEGVIGKWLKQLGEFVKEDEPLVEIMSDKITAILDSTAEGTLVKIIAQEGETLPIDSPICVISSESAVAGAKSVSEVLPIRATVKEDTGLYAPDPNMQFTLPPPTAARAKTPEEDSASRLREKSSPLVRRILEEHGLDPIMVLPKIKGSGNDGRVTKQDALDFVAKAANKSAPSSPAAIGAGAVPVFAVPAGVGAPTDTDSDVTPLAGIRKIIAERLSYSEHVAPHVTTFSEVDVTNLVALRAKFKQWAQDEASVNLTYMPFVIKAVCAGLKAFPAMNSSLIDNNLYVHKRIHIAVAVSLEGAGLILPVIKDADRMGIVGLAAAVQDLASRARKNQLTADEVRGSTFTISNPGAFGGWISTPIINQPNAAILNTGKIMKMPWVMPDDSIVARSIMYLSLSYDHRVVDGENSVKFLQFVKKSLEQIESFLLR